MTFGLRVHVEVAHPRFWQTFSARVYLQNQSPSFGAMGAGAPLLMDGMRRDANQQRERLSLAGCIVFFSPPAFSKLTKRERELHGFPVRK